MPVTPTYPGVYVEEIPSGVRTITGVATSITAFVGYTERGPINEPVRVFNFGDYERTFGGLTRDSEVAYAVQQFYLNGGGEAYVVRVVQDAAKAQLVLQNIDGDNVLEVAAASEGDWGNGLRLEVDYATQNPDSVFNLTATRFEQRDGRFVAAESELFRNLSMNSQSGTYAPDVVQASSKLIQLTRTDASLLTFMNGFSLSRDLGGSNFPTLDATNTLIAGTLDSNTRFDLVLTAPLPTTLEELITALSTAIANQGLDSALSVERANADGSFNATGNYVRLVSSATPTEVSAVTIRSAPNNDAARSLGFGIANGGREFTGTSGLRPAMTGTVSTDLATSIGDSFPPAAPPDSGALSIRITNAAGDDILPSTAINVTPAVSIGPALATALQTQLRAIGHPATSQATVALVGNVLQIKSSADDPNAILFFSGGGATTLGLPTTAMADRANVQQLTVGVGSRGQQTGAVAGRAGEPPDDPALIIGSKTTKAGLYALEDIDLFNLLVIPGTTKLGPDPMISVIAAATVYCEKRRAMFLIDPPQNATVRDVGDWAATASTSRNAVVFFPYLNIPDPLREFRPYPMPASGTVAGIFARTDTQRGVWKAPAGTEAVVQGSVGPAIPVTDDENGVLNPLAVNCIRKFPVYNTVLWGARTRRGADALADEYKYIPVRRLALFIEESLFRGLKWVVFEPNDEPLWAQIRLNVGAFMQNLFRQGAFQGSTPREAYLVKCDSETTTQNDINLGIVNIVVGFAPLKPAEFVILKIQQLAGQIEV